MITQEQKQKLIDLNDSRVNEILEVKEYGKWYRYRRQPKFLAFVKDRSNRYGFNMHGIWFNMRAGEPLDNGYILATKEEVEQRLIEEAKRRGYKNGNYECLLGDYGTEENVKECFYYDTDGCLYHGGEDDANNIVFEKGTWAEIKNPIKEKIEKLEQELKQLRNKLKSLEEKL